VTSVPDGHGDALAVLHTLREDQVDEALALFKKQGLPNLYLPRRDHFIKVEALPLLGTGKLDLRALRQIANRAIGKQPAGDSTSVELPVAAGSS
jgi:acyl-[acyl-carrier-protein]-phospholipid O-acyltransferase/long-chain-fatty-acid--[acyl-carrier-protein] ligase